MAKGLGVRTPRMQLDARLYTASVFKWTKRLPPHGVVMADAWLSAVEAMLARRDLSDACVALLKRAMVADVREMIAELAADDQVVRRERLTTAWAEWYPKWVRGRLGDLEAAHPDVFVSEDAARRAQASRDKALNGRVVRAHRVAVAARDLLALVQASSGQMVEWSPDVLASALRPTARKDQRPNVRRLADSLVALGVAEWRTWPSGQHWALVATGKAIDGLGDAG